jgi:hypothetical protein
VDSSVKQQSENLGALMSNQISKELQVLERIHSTKGWSQRACTLFTQAIEIEVEF